MNVIHVNGPTMMAVIADQPIKDCHTCMLSCSHCPSLNSFSVKQEDQQLMMNIKCLVKEGEKVLSFVSKLVPTVSSTSPSSSFP